MRQNLPVTANEYPIHDNTLIVSRTDLKGRLTFFNDEFVAAAGFTEAELMGQPHNIIRHPDMPPEAFGNLWETLQAGKPWVGAVKNRRKNGDFYWVLATASPIRENDQIVGYTSIRTKLPADKRVEAEKVYALLRAKKAQGYAISSGVIRRKTFLDKIPLVAGTVRARLISLIALLGVFMLVAAAIGIVATRDSNTRLRSIYEDRAVPLAQLGEINDLMLKNMMVQYEAIENARSGRPATELPGVVKANSDKISQIWTQYLATYLTPEEKDVSDKFAEKRVTYRDQGVRPALDLIVGGKLDDAGKYLIGPAAQMYAAAKQELDRLVAIQIQVAKSEFEIASEHFVIAGIVAAIVLIVALLSGTWIGAAAIRSILGPLAHLNQTMRNITNGKLDNRIQIDRDDELSEALRNLQNVQAIVRFNANEVEEVQRKAASRRKVEMSELASDFENAAGSIIDTVSSASQELESSATALSRTAARSQELAITVAAASEEASTNVSSVASATEEMASSVNEISRQVQESARIASEAVTQAHRTNERVAELSQAAARIGDVVELINTIAGQTNLLALNATIEAARAGEAGRGFAVVASEVKALAEQTAKATGEISTQISGIQAATDQSVVAIREIGATIGRMSEIASTIASAVEEQGAATQEISRNVQQAAQGTQEVSSNITDVQRGATDTGSASSHVLSAAQSLSKDSARLKQQVASFLATVRAA